jgi:hypothetical protein
MREEKGCGVGDPPCAKNPYASWLCKYLTFFFGMKLAGLEAEVKLIGRRFGWMN